HVSQHSSKVGVPAGVQASQTTDDRGAAKAAPARDELSSLPLFGMPEAAPVLSSAHTGVIPIAESAPQIDVFHLQGWILSGLPVTRSQAGQTPWKTSPMKSLGLLKPLPHFASVGAVGFAATISSSDLPCFFRAATFSRVPTSKSR